MKSLFICCSCCLSKAGKAIRYKVNQNSSNAVTCVSDIPASKSRKGKLVACLILENLMVMGHIFQILKASFLFPSAQVSHYMNH